MKPTGGDGWVATVRAIISVVERSDIHELEVKSGHLRVSLRRAFDQATVRSTAAEANASQLPFNWHVIQSPLAGIWYDAPAPGSPPYVSVGDALAAGTIIGLVETMKVFNEVAADMAGTVRQVFVRRGELVAAHAPLIAIDTSDTSQITAENIT